MKILIDADGCPVVDSTIVVGKKFNVEVIIMCDTSHNFNKPGIETIILSKGSDSVDFALVNKVSKGDIIVTQDYGLAAMVLSKGGYPINQNGKLYTNENIDQLLFTR
ncbi:MAG: YaiI/YqxD family protein [Romboutsia sp.]|uniref:YaiI/YqxD family protein n=1 Tax=Romboutsia sp. TaxID=1965302 RepID=UPI003F2FCB63